MMNVDVFLYQGEALPADVRLRDTQWVMPPTLALQITTYAPTVTGVNPQLVVPGIAVITITTFAPLVTASNHQIVVPGVVALSLTLFVPDVIATTGGTQTCIRRARLMMCGA